MAMKFTAFRCPPELLEEIERLGVELDLNYSQAVRFLIIAGLGTIVTKAD